MKENLIITISREYGSGGKEIGEILAKEFNIPFYDKEIIIKAAEKSGLSAEYIEKEEQKFTSSMLFNLSNGRTVGSDFKPLSDQIFIAQSNVIKEIAQQGSCIIVGRCADYILNDMENCFNVFICADDDFRTERVIKEYNIRPEDVQKKLKEKDKYRARHYNYYSANEWGNVDNYHLCVNSAVFGIEKTAQLIKSAVELF